jgi:anti-sigma factor RsiW
VITADCDAIRDDLDGFADGELRGAALRHVAAHLESCRRCAEEVDVRRSLGGMIRDSVAGEYQAPVADGLAPGVIARVRAESAMSWRAGLRRASEDWHWVIVGGGALTATFLSMTFCVALLLFGTATPSAESISTIGRNLRAAPAPLYAEVSRRGSDGPVVLVQLDTGRSGGAVLPPSLDRREEERQWVDELGEAMARGWASLSEAERQHTARLLENITRARLAEPT